MIKQSLIVFNLPVLFNILNEIKENLNFELYNFNKKKDLDKISDSIFGNFLIITNSKDGNSFNENTIIIDNFPVKIIEIVEKINIYLLKRRFNKQSDIKINDFEIDINSRTIKNQGKKLKLTEKEIEIILYLNNSKESKTIDKLQKEVWGHANNLETHTVETHIYRLRKKINEVFKDKDFIVSTKKGYRLV